MRPEQWQQIKSVLESALDLPPSARSAFVSSSFTDAGQRAEALALLDLQQEDADPFEQSAYDLVTENGSSFSTKSLIGSRIGKYKVLSELGAGGMGTIFLAERADGEYEQKVALKVIRRGIGSETILRRFVSERQILASLDHPNIAHLIDGGTTDDDLPYFVMEYVNGETITDYARNHRLDISERLDLFREICGAVVFAHQNLVIHRDIKPSNIFVSTNGVPKLLDFGIAKLLTRDTNETTATQHFAFTPEYASPEQIKGENLTTATDIYSLGVVLYELLTGSRPFAFEGKNFGQIVETAANSDPVRPSAVEQNGPSPVIGRDRLKGDLDTIILKALKKDPDRRYSSVEQFSEDIRRHLKGLPVFALDDTWSYRLRAFTRRNPLLVGSAAIAIVILITGIVATAILAQRAESERQKAELRFKDVRSMATSLIFEVNEKIDESPIKARQLLVTRAIEYLDELANEADDDPTLQADLATGYEKVGDVQANYFGSGTGDTAGALANHQKALKLRYRLFAADESVAENTLAIAKSHLKIADLSVTAGQTAVALENYNLAVTAIERSYGQHPENRDVKGELAKAYAKLGQGILRSGSISKALMNYEKALGLMKEIAETDPANARLQHSVSVYQSYTGYAKLEMGLNDDALDHFAESLRIDREIWNGDSDNTENLRNLASGEQWVGYALRSMLRFSESRDHLKKALEIQTAVYERDKSNVGDVNSLGDCNLELGMTLSDSGEPARAATYFQRAIILYETVAKTDANNLSALRQASFTRTRLADALKREGKTAAAIRLYERALHETEQIVARDAKNNEFQYDLATCLSRLGENGVNASTNLTRSLDIFKRLVSESPENAVWLADLDRTKSLLAKRRNA